MAGECLSKLKQSLISAFLFFERLQVVFQFSFYDHCLFLKSLLDAKLTIPKQLTLCCQMDTNLISFNKIIILVAAWNGL